MAHNYFWIFSKIFLEMVDNICIIPSQAKRERKMDNGFRIGDRVVWGFCFDVADSGGVVIGFDGEDKVVVRVEYGDHLPDGTDVIYVDCIQLESEYLAAESL